MRWLWLSAQHIPLLRQEVGVLTECRRDVPTGELLEAWIARVRLTLGTSCSPGATIRQPPRVVEADTHVPASLRHFCSLVSVVYVV